MRALAVLIVLCTTSLGSWSLGQSDLDSLKTSHGLLITAINSANPDLLIKRMHPEGLGFFRMSQSPVQFSTRNSVQDMAPSLVTDLSMFVSVPLNDVYRVVGDTGIVCSTFSKTPVAGQDKKKRTEYNRATFVYTRSQGAWLLVSWHTSNIPLD